MSRKHFISVSLGLLIVFLIALLFSEEYHAYPLKSSIGVVRQLTLITSALEAFFNDMKRYPSNEEGLDVLVNPPSRDSELWKGAYIDEESKFFKGDITRDVWGERFRYFYCPCPSHIDSHSYIIDDSYRIYSYGKNKRNDFGEKDDLTTWKDIDKSYYKEDYLPPNFFWSRISQVVAKVIFVWFTLLVIYYLVWGKR
jgi:general secretion pathway protein G